MDDDDGWTVWVKLLISEWVVVAMKTTATFSGISWIPIPLPKPYPVLLQLPLWSRRWIPISRHYPPPTSSESSSRSFRSRISPGRAACADSGTRWPPKGTWSPELSFPHGNWRTSSVTHSLEASGETTHSPNSLSPIASCVATALPVLPSSTPFRSVRYSCSATR